jgi:hypothetical protein
MWLVKLPCWVKPVAQNEKNIFQLSFFRKKEKDRLSQTFQGQEDWIVFLIFTNFRDHSLRYALYYAEVR